jgi:hypothetical protein
MKSKILQLRARNVKSIREVDISPDGTVHEIKGDTGQGKSAILLAIRGGLEGLDPEMVRNGETQAEIEITLSDGQIKRIVPRDGRPSVKVKDGNGQAVKRATDFLRTISGGGSFDPVAWVSLGAEAKGRKPGLRQQRDELLSSIPAQLTRDDVIDAVKELGGDDPGDVSVYIDALKKCNLDDMEFKHSAFSVCSMFENIIYEHRTAQNARLRAEEEALKLAQEEAVGAGQAPEKISAAMVEEAKSYMSSALDAYHEAKAQRDSRQSLLDRRQEFEEELESLPKDTMADLAKQRNKWESQRDKETLKERELIKKLEACRAKLGEALTELDDVATCERMAKHRESLTEDIARLDKDIGAGGISNEDLDALAVKRDEAQVDVDNLERWRNVQSRRLVYRQEHDKCSVLDELIELFRNTIPKSVLAKSDLQIEGLGIREEMITINDVPIYALGTSEQMKVGVQVAAAINPNTAFILIDRAESLGSKDKAILAQEAERLGLQLILTVVDEKATPSDSVTIMSGGKAVGTEV